MTTRRGDDGARSRGVVGIGGRGGDRPTWRSSIRTTTSGRGAVRCRTGWPNSRPTWFGAQHHRHGLHRVPRELPERQTPRHPRLVGETCLSPNDGRIVPDRQVMGGIVADRLDLTDSEHLDEAVGAHADVADGRLRGIHHAGVACAASRGRDDRGRAPAGLSTEHRSRPACDNSANVADIRHAGTTIRTRSSSNSPGRRRTRSWC